MGSFALCALAWIGQRGTYALTASIFIGMTLPGLSSYARPYLPHAVFVLLVLAFLRVDASAVASRARRPGLILIACLWMMALIPLAVIAVVKGFGIAVNEPQLLLILFLITCGPPVMSAPAFIYLMGLEGALSLALLVAATAIVPVSAPLLAGLLMGPALELDSLDLALRLSALLGGSLLLATILRRLAGTQRITAARSHIDGMNVVVLLFFAIAAMDGVAASFLSRPGFTFSILALTFAVAFLQIGLTLLAFAGAGRADAFTIAHAAGNRNMGLMVAAMGGVLPEVTWLWFALGQMPIYTLPMLLKPFAQRYCGKNTECS